MPRCVASWGLVGSTEAVEQCGCRLGGPGNSNGYQHAAREKRSQTSVVVGGLLREAGKGVRKLVLGNKSWWSRAKDLQWR